MKAFSVIIISALLSSLLLINFAQAVGVGVKPKEINIKAKVGREVETEMLVINVASEPAIYQVYPDALEDEIKVGPTDFRLEPDGTQIVKIKMNFNSPGRFSTNISVVARPLGASGLPAASGVKIPITVSASGMPFWWLVLGVSVAICLIMIFVVLLIKIKRNRGSSLEEKVY